ncbi:hypothetical protein HmCmsJML142_04415 [Escherichia coli]|nr:hypothetical protein HmCmsJML142_04415 [Escherichia coli]
MASVITSGQHVVRFPLVVSYAEIIPGESRHTAVSHTRHRIRAEPFIHAYRRPRHHAEPAVTHGIFMPAGIAVMGQLAILVSCIAERRHHPQCVRKLITVFHVNPVQFIAARNVRRDMKIPRAQRGLMFRRPCRRTGYGQTNGCGQNGGIKFTHNYLSLFCNKKGAISGARIWVIKFS